MSDKLIKYIESDIRINHKDLFDHLDDFLGILSNADPVYFEYLALRFLSILHAGQLEIEREKNNKMKELDHSIRSIFYREQAQKVEDLMNADNN